jgi:hypothetical protein
MSRIIFPEWTETLKKALRLLLLGAPVYLVLLIGFGVRDGKAIRVGYMPEQPVPYSHALHAGQLGMDCRYCHSAIERTSTGAVPPAATCMNCHSQVVPNSPKLVPVREAYVQNTPLRWVRVHDLPDYVYFNHSAHVTRGVGCESCHGRVDTMVKVWQDQPLTMGWCLDCHRNPEKALRKPENVTVMGYQREPGEGERVKQMLNINPPTDCSTCHR